MTTAFQTSFQKALLQKLPRRRGLATGFTLVELMIVVAIVGILAAVALPTYLRARDAAKAGALVGEVVGLAKECAVVAASDISTGVTAGDGIRIDNQCDDAGGGGDIVGVIQDSDNGMPEGIKCLDATSADGDTTVTATVTADGALSCEFS